VLLPRLFGGALLLADFTPAVGGETRIVDLDRHEQTRIERLLARINQSLAVLPVLQAQVAGDAGLARAEGLEAARQQLDLRQTAVLAGRGGDVEVTGLLVDGCGQADYLDQFGGQGRVPATARGRGFDYGGVAAIVDVPALRLLAPLHFA
jgi:hypothetical protein